MWGGEATRRSGVLVSVLACELVTARSLLPAFRHAPATGSCFQTRAVTAAEQLREYGPSLDFAEWVHLVDAIEERGFVHDAAGVVAVLPTSSRPNPWAAGRDDGAVQESSFLFPHAVPGSMPMQVCYRDVLNIRVKRWMERSGDAST
ncbi:hypothetical protein GZL_01041 [Streptomyces sp. 769]|nr:hypothetical protein GZL_01041 [Streptomyces sp. 769]